MDVRSDKVHPLSERYKITHLIMFRLLRMSIRVQNKAVDRRGRLSYRLKGF